MALAATVVKKDKRSGILTAVITLVASGSYATPGDAVNLPAVVGYTNKQPTLVLIGGIAGYSYAYNPATNVVLVRQPAGTGAPQAEIANGAYPAAVIADTIRALAIWIM